VRWTPETLKVVMIRNTLDVSELWISPGLLAEARAQPHPEIAPTPAAMQFDADGNLIAPLCCAGK
jgi:hypothetical protein